MFLEAFFDQRRSLLRLLVHRGVENVFLKLRVSFQLDKDFGIVSGPNLLS
jgi:hypothetical protein